MLVTMGVMVVIMVVMMMVVMIIMMVVNGRAKKKICGFPVSRPYLAFGRRNPDPKLFYWIMLVSVST